MVAGLAVSGGHPAVERAVTGAPALAGTTTAPMTSRPSNTVTRASSTRRRSATTAMTRPLSAPAAPARLELRLPLPVPLPAMGTWALAQPPWTSSTCRDRRNMMRPNPGQSHRPCQLDQKRLPWTPCGRSFGEQVGRDVTHALEGQNHDQSVQGTGVEVQRDERAGEDTDDSGLEVCQACGVAQAEAGHANQPGEPEADRMGQQQRHSEHGPGGPVRRCPQVQQAAGPQTQWQGGEHQGNRGAAQVAEIVVQLQVPGT